MPRYDDTRTYARRRYGLRPIPRWSPGGTIANAPLFSWDAWGGPLAGPPYPVPRYGFEYWRPPRPPRESPSYGRSGDRLARQWARRYGYDIEMAIRPEQRRWPGVRRNGW